MVLSYEPRWHEKPAMEITHDNCQPVDPSQCTAIDSVSEYYLCFRFLKFAPLEAQDIAQNNCLMN